MSTNPELLQELLERGVPWPLAVEAVASTALDNDARVQTQSLTRAEREKESPPSLSCVANASPPAKAAQRQQEPASGIRRRALVILASVPCERRSSRAGV